MEGEREPYSDKSFFAWSRVVTCHCLPLLWQSVRSDLREVSELVEANLMADSARRHLNHQLVRTRPARSRDRGIIVMICSSHWVGECRVAQPLVHCTGDHATGFPDRWRLIPERFSQLPIVRVDLVRPNPGNNLRPIKAGKLPRFENHLGEISAPPAWVQRPIDNRVPNPLPRLRRLTPCFTE